MWGILAGLVSLYTGGSILFDSNCSTVGLSGGGYRRAFFTCYEAGVGSGMDATVAGVLIILFGLAAGFVGFMSLFR